MKLNDNSTIIYKTRGLVISKKDKSVYVTMNKYSSPSGNFELTFDEWNALVVKAIRIAGRPQHSVLNQMLIHSNLIRGPHLNNQATSREYSSSAKHARFSQRTKLLIHKFIQTKYEQKIKNGVSNDEDPVSTKSK